MVALRLVAPTSAPPALRLACRLLPGRIVECSGPTEGASARTSTAVAIVRHVQAAGETVAWIQRAGGPLFPPDLHDAGIDLEALVVVHIPASGSVRTGMCKAAELLARSGAFGLIVVDLEADAAGGSAMTAWLGRMLGLARQHDSRIVLLTEKPTHADSLGTLVGLRIESRRRLDAHGAFVVDHHVIKNKSGAPFEVAPDPYRHPDGIGP